MKYCFGFRADLEGYSSKENPPAFPALPAQPELSLWGRGASRGVLSLVSVWCVCTDKVVWQCLVIAAMFIRQCQEPLALAVRISSGFMGAGSGGCRHGKEAEPALSCWGLGVLLMLLPSVATWPHPGSALGSLCFGVFPFAPCAVD